jgi:hypothetical protein
LTAHFARGRVQVAFLPIDGKAIRQSGLYTIEGTSLVSELFNNGEPTHFQIVNNELRVDDPDDGTTIFTRK